MKAHWTARSTEDYLFRIVADFIAQLGNKMESLTMSQDQLAQKLGVTKGRISQLLNYPRNISLGKMIEYARALGMKVSAVAYEDDDPDNKKGPIDSEIFRICWENFGKPRDFWDLATILKSKEVGSNTVWIDTLESFPKRIQPTNLVVYHVYYQQMGKIFGTTHELLGFPKQEPLPFS